MHNKTKKWISAASLALLLAALFHFSACDPSKKTGGGTGGSVRDTATVSPAKP